MDHTLKSVFYNHFSDRDTFEMQTGSRPWHMLLLITKGSFFCRFGDRTFQIEKDEIAFFPQNVNFERWVSAPISFHQFGFITTEETDRPLPRAGKLALPHSHVRALGERLDTVAAIPLANAKPHLSNALEQILLEHAVYEQSRSAEQSGRDRDVAYVIGYMTEHLAEPIRVEELAQEMHISRVGLLGKFKRQMGCTLSDFLIGLRMQRAKYLLLESNARINEIAVSCGYSNAYYFSNAFKKHCGCSPLAYRRAKLGASGAAHPSTAEIPQAARSAAENM